MKWLPIPQIFSSNNSHFPSTAQSPQSTHSVLQRSLSFQSSKETGLRSHTPFNKWPPFFLDEHKPWSYFVFRRNTFELASRSRLQANFFDWPVKNHISFISFPFWKTEQALISRSVTTMLRVQRIKHNLVETWFTVTITRPAPSWFRTHYLWVLP